MAGDVDQRDRGATSEILLSSSAAQSLTTVLLSSSWLFSNNPLQPSLYSSTLLTQRTTLQGWFLDVIKYICSICISLPVWHERLFGGGLRSAQEAVDRMMYIHEFIHDFFWENQRGRTNPFQLSWKLPGKWENKAWELWGGSKVVHQYSLSFYSTEN